MPTLRQRSDGCYFVDLRVNGERRRTLLMRNNLPVTDKGVAERMYREILGTLEEAAEEAPHAGPDPRIRDIREYYVDTYLPARNAAARTLTQAHRHLSMFCDYCADNHIGRVSQLSAQRVEGFAAWLAGKDLNATTVRNHVGTVRAALNMAVEAGMLERSPVKRWVTPRIPTPEIWPLTPDQVRAVLDIFRRDRPDFAPIAEWIALTGNRPSDAISLLWRHVDLERAHVERISVKSKDLRQYAISRAAVGLLRRLPRGKPDSPVFLAPEGGPWTVNRVYHIFTRTLIDAGFERDVSPKDLRHTFGSIMANAPINCPLPTLRVLMGHSHIETTMRYVHPGEGREALDAMDDALSNAQKTTE